MPVCAPGQTTNCPTETLEITVIGNQPQGTINLKYDTLLAADSVHVKLKVYDGVGPYTMIFKNSINSRIDTVMKDGLMYKGLMNNKSPYLVDSDKS